MLYASLYWPWEEKQWRQYSQLTDSWQVGGKTQ
jgi:hypothetical protein